MNHLHSCQDIIQSADCSYLIHFAKSEVQILNLHVSASLSLLHYF